jgi:hypothetical protein
MHSLIMKTLDEFFRLHICCFEDYKKVKINFIGSVAFFLQEEIKKTAEKHNCAIGHIVKNPIDKLIEYHFKNR